MKKCTVCNDTKPLDSFFNSRTAKDGKSYRCKECDTRAKRKWAENNQERAAYSARNKRLKHCYSIDITTYETMLKAQDYSCAICGTKDNKISGRTQNFSVDHNHTTGAVRGLLCNQCNRALGMFNDSIDILEKAAKYLTTGKDTH